ncbi:N-acetyltransferase ESCO1 isoform X1 [Antechinus flavipes]|uniref:N-acetyltransferase ESCO1 isoform X1 n=1 Tax=Antechinus flavipes TaxID=38775 RepID=UPI0022361CCA|nr:N-acetyltransferase ESCO1 isoform X1 [Antechinus flavipes]XP_051826318.1 N-acetyltransferase ESCO1 isoform X1 [Antechinus flavipes]
MAAQKRKSTLVEHSAKRRKLDNSKLTNSANRERNFETQHVSNKSKSNNCKIQKKKSPKTFVKADRSVTNKTTNNFARSSYQTKLIEKSQSEPELNRTNHKSLSLTKSALKSPNRINSPQTTPKSTKIKHKNPSESNHTISSNAPGKTEKSNLNETKIYFENECQRQLKTDFKNSSGIENTKNTRHSVLDSTRTKKTIQKGPESEMKSTKGKSKENNSAASTKIVKNNNKKGQGVKNSQRNLTKSACKELEKPLNKSSSGYKTNEYELGTHMATRSTKAFFNEKKSSNCIHKTEVKKHSQEPRQNRKPQKKSVKETPKSKCGNQLNEQLNRRSQRLQQLADVSTKSLRNREIKSQILEVKQSISTNRAESCNKVKTKLNKIKVTQKNLKRKLKSSGSKDESTASEVSNSPERKKSKVNNKLDGACDPQCKQGSQKDHQHEIKKEGKNSVPVISSRDKKAKVTTLLISKRNEEITKKELVHPKLKSRTKSKNCQPTVPEGNTDKPSEEVVKTKRFSILELCEEIAGEIESDTVEVKRESSLIEDGKEDEKPTKVELTEIETQMIAQKEPSENVQCKRFFPSRKANPVKCVLNGLNRLASKKSKWTKIKLGKANHLCQNSLGSPVAPKLDLLKTKPKLPQTSVHLIASEMRLPKSQSQSLIPKPCDDKDLAYQEEKQKEIYFQEVKSNGKTTEKSRITERTIENGQLDNQIKLHKPVDNQMKHSLEPTLDESFSLYLESSPENTPMKSAAIVPPLLNQTKNDAAENKSPDITPKQLINTFNNQISKTSDNRGSLPNHSSSTNCNSPLEIKISKDLKLKEAEKDGDKQLIIDAGQKRFGAISCNICGMLYTASNPEDETQHLLFHNQFISAVKYVGWKKERLLAEYPDGKIIMVLPEDPKYALKKVEEIREMVDNDLGFQQAPLMCSSRIKTLLFISNDKKVVGCLIAEHIQWGYRVIEDKVPDVNSEKEKVIFERQKAWCCSTSPEPAVCGISRIWVFSMMRRRKIASRMIECLRSNFIYGSYLSKEEIAFSDPTPDGKLFATQYCGTGQFLVYNFINGQKNS